MTAKIFRCDFHEQYSIRCSDTANKFFCNTDYGIFFKRCTKHRPSSVDGKNVDVSVKEIELEEYVTYQVIGDIMES